jgi:hypothetical protein
MGIKKLVPPPEAIGASTEASARASAVKRVA